MALAGLFLMLCGSAISANAQTSLGAFPFEATFDLPGVAESRKVQKGEPFGFLLCLHASETGIDHVEMTITLPPQEVRLGGETSWTGALAPHEEACLNIGLKSRTEMPLWSRAVRAQIQFRYQGMNVNRTVTWTEKGLEDTGFVAREN